MKQRVKTVVLGVSLGIMIFLAIWYLNPIDELDPIEGYVRNMRPEGGKIVFEIRSGSDELLVDIRPFDEPGKKFISVPAIHENDKVVYRRMLWFNRIRDELNEYEILEVIECTKDPRLVSGVFFALLYIYVIFHMQ